MPWVDSAAVWTDFVPEAIHNQAAIKLLVSDIYVMYICFYITTDFIFIFY